jgi:hypothetical protein
MSLDPSKLSTINQVIGKLTSAQSELQNAATATADPDALDKINDAYAVLQRLIDLRAQAQAAADDAEFKQAISNLKKEAKTLSDTEEEIKKIISIVAQAGRVVGYIAEAIVLISGL